MLYSTSHVRVVGKLNILKVYFQIHSHSPFHGLRCLDYTYKFNYIFHHTHPSENTEQQKTKLVIQISLKVLSRTMNEVKRKEFFAGISKVF